MSRFFASSARVDPFSVSATIVSVSRVRASEAVNWRLASSRAVIVADNSRLVAASSSE